MFLQPRALLAAALAALLLHNPAAAALNDARELRALPGGAWLALDKRGVALLAPDGSERARVALRGKHLDSRDNGTGQVFGVVMDSDTQRTMALRVDLARGELRMRPLLASPSFPLEAVCLYRDAQGLDQVFLVSDEGLAEQWLLRGEAEPQLLRRLALPPQTRQCRVDDASQRLFAKQNGVGLWAYNAEAEGLPDGRPVALRAPYGPLRHELKSIALREGRLALLDDERHVSLWLATQQGVWRKQRDAVLPKGQPLEVWLAAQPAAAAAPRNVALPIVLPRVQTEPVAGFGDAADDPAIWIHPSDPTRSLVLGANKKQGLLVYDLAGRQRQLLEVGRINNVDLRQRVRLPGAGAEQDIAVATQRDDLSLVMFTIDAEGQVREASRIPTGLKDIYGVCLYQPAGGGLEVIVNDKDGSHQRWRLEASGERISGQIVQRFKLASQPEACVADDAAARLFIGEERRGVWSLDLADAKAAPKLVMPVGGLLHADVEGLALYHGRGASHLVISSQGSNSYVVIDSTPPHRVRGAFRIGINLEAGIDGVSETDGLEVTSKALGPRFPRGALVVQDGFKRLPDGPQNFKIIDWADIARALQLAD